MGALPPRSALTSAQALPRVRDRPTPGSRADAASLVVGEPPLVAAVGVLGATPWTAWLPGLCLTRRAITPAPGVGVGARMVATRAVDQTGAPIERHQLPADRAPQHRHNHRTRPFETPRDHRTLGADSMACRAVRLQGRICREASTTPGSDSRCQPRSARLPCRPNQALLFARTTRPACGGTLRRLRPRLGQKTNGCGGTARSARGQLESSRSPCRRASSQRCATVQPRSAPNRVTVTR